MPAIDVVVADRYPSGQSSLSERGSLVAVVMRAFANASPDQRLLWLSPCREEDLSSRTPVDPRLTVECAPVPRGVYDAYYLTVGAARIWTVLHGLAAELRETSLTDDAWQQFLTVNRSVATLTASHAPIRSRITVHDYTLLPAVPEIRRLRPDVSIVYVHHTSWPHSDQAQDLMTRNLLQHLVRMMAAADAVVVSAQQWRTNLQTWAPAAPVNVVAPGVDPEELKQQALAAANGYWASTLGGDSNRPVLAAVGRADPSKNFDTLLKIWAGLVREGAPGTLCLHLTPTTRGAVAIYRACAESLYRWAAEANEYRSGSVRLFERQSWGDALWLLQNADIVVACSLADGWNLVAVEACALGTDAQRLILSSQVGAAELLGPIACVVHDPSSEAEITQAIRAAIENRLRPNSMFRKQILLPSPTDWWDRIIELHHRFGRSQD